MHSSHRDIVVQKPWGYEYLVYESKDVALWLLHIEKGKGTSLHCHPLKTTGLLLLEGEAEISFIADRKVISAPSKQMIRRGLFHSTTALSEGGAYLLEIETPNDKEDLVRLTDNYGRSHDGYEKKNQWSPRDNSHIWVEVDPASGPQTFTVSNSTFEVFVIQDLAEVFHIPDDEIIMFLHGGIGKSINGRQHLATVPGDIGLASIVKTVAREMEYCAPHTTILKVSPNESI